MRILLTNDDGFGAEGISSLQEVFSMEHEVYVMAPSKNRSGASASLSLWKGLKVEKHGENIYALDGSPVDCVIAALRGNFFPHKPDVVVSGINYGANLGTDIVYSGTCAAAKQACLYGTPGIALSVQCLENGECGFSSMSDFALKNLDLLLSLFGNPHSYPDIAVLPYYINVNAPTGKYKGLRFTEPCHRMYGDKILFKEENGETKSTLVGGGETVGSLPWNKESSEERSDGIAVNKGYVSVSRISVMPYTDNAAFLSKESDFVLDAEKSGGKK